MWQEEEEEPLLEANRSLCWSSSASCVAVRGLVGNGAERGGQSDSELEREEEVERRRDSGTSFGLRAAGSVGEGASSALSEERFLGSPLFATRAGEGSRFDSLVCSNKNFSLLD